MTGNQTYAKKPVDSERMDKCADMFTEGWTPDFHSVATEAAYHEYLKRAYRAGYTTGHADAQDKSLG